jgi:AcrR family transcriptional regulator
MENKKDQIHEATLKVIARYGMSKSSVGDIAKEAKLSRQTVYNLFAGGKDDIYRAAIKYLIDKSLERARSALSESNHFGDQLDVLFDVFVVETFKFGQGDMNTHDIVHEAQDVAPEIINAGYEAKRKMYEDILKPFRDNLTANGFSPENLADQIECAGRAYAVEARSAPHLKSLIAVQKQLVVLAVS